MPAYHRLGELPQKRHTQFRKADGTLYAEELFGTEGFSGNYSLLYYQRPPTQVKKIAKCTACQSPYEIWDEEVQRHHHLQSTRLAPGGDAVLGRQVLMFNNDVQLALAKPREEMSYFYRDGDSDLLYFVHSGQGVLESNFGLLPYREGDYIVIPRGTTFRLQYDSDVEPVFLVVEARGSIEPPQRYLNKYGQLLEHSPYCERDIRRPQELASHT